MGSLLWKLKTNFVHSLIYLALKTKNFENAVKYYKDYIRCYDLFTSIDKNIFADINGENKKQEEIEEIIFSDSIILYSADWLRLIQRVANVMAALLELGFWFRGGIGYGKYYGDISNSRISMVSEGLVEAVELEEKKAIYPRIILSSKVLTKMYDEARDLYQLAQLLIQCEDDFWCINPFFLIPDFTVTIKNINKEITSYSENQRICDKYIWLGELMNYFCIWSSMENQKEYYQKVEISKTEAKNLPCKILNNKKITHKFIYIKHVYFRYPMDLSILKRSFNENVEICFNENGHSDSENTIENNK